MFWIRERLVISISIIIAVLFPLLHSYPKTIQRKPDGKTYLSGQILPKQEMEKIGFSQLSHGCLSLQSKKKTEKPLLLRDRMEKFLSSYSNLLEYKYITPKARDAPDFQASMTYRYISKVPGLIFHWNVNSYLYLWN